FFSCRLLQPIDRGDDEAYRKEFERPGKHGSPDPQTVRQPGLVIGLARWGIWPVRGWSPHRLLLSSTRTVRVTSRMTSGPTISAGSQTGRPPNLGSRHSGNDLCGRRDRTPGYARPIKVVPGGRSHRPLPVRTSTIEDGNSSGGILEIAALPVRAPRPTSRLR